MSCCSLTSRLLSSLMRSGVLAMEWKMSSRNSTCAHMRAKVCVCVIEGVTERERVRTLCVGAAQDVWAQQSMCGRVSRINSEIIMCGCVSRKKLKVHQCGCVSRMRLKTHQCGRIIRSGLRMHYVWVHMCGHIMCGRASRPGAKMHYVWAREQARPQNALCVGA